MKLPRPTSRHLLILVALVGLGLVLFAWMQRRSERFQAEASRYLTLWMVDGQIGSAASGRYFNLAMKYERAAGRPWLPVKPDPHEPEVIP